MLLCSMSWDHNTGKKSHVRKNHLASPTSEEPACGVEFDVVQ